MKKYLFIAICAFIHNNVYWQAAENGNPLSKEEICYENGNKKYAEGKYTQALYWYEKGIEQGPMYEENYYGAAKVFFLSTETVWGVMYGELFMILSTQDSLQTEISKELFNAYFESFSLNKGKTVASFNNNIIVYSDSFERRNKFPEIFDNLMTNAAKNVRFIDIASLITIRQKFLSQINNKETDFKKPLFAYWDKIITSGHWQAYNYWLFAYGNTSQSATWARENKQKWNAFLKWKENNPINLTPDNCFSRYLME